MNVWRGVPARILSWLLLLTVFVAVSCKDDDDATAADVTVDFDTASQTLRESDASAVVSLKLNGAASRDGKLTFSVESAAVYGTDYTTTPSVTDNKLVVPVVKGQTAVKFTVVPVDNTTLSGDRTIKFTLTETDAGFKAGEKATETITLVDDEGPSKANFAASEGALAADQKDGVKVSINFSSKLPSAGTLKVSIASTAAAYGTNYTTTPAATNNVIAIPVNAGATEASFTVVPVSISAGDITFTLTTPDGGIVLGTGLTYKLTLTAASSTLTVTQLRALFTGAGNVTIDQDKTVTAVVISTKDNINASNLWIHDGTRGIMVRFTEANTFSQGDQITIKVKGAVLGEFNNVLQLGTDSKFSIVNATKIGTAALPDYKTITMSDMNAKHDDYEGDRIKLENVHFTGANGTANFSANSGNINIADASNTIGILRAETTAAFKNNIQPAGSGTVYGILNEYKGAAQISPQGAADIFTDNATATITLDPASLSFGDVAKGGTSTAKSFTITSAGLTNDVTVTAPTYYTVARSESDTYTSSLTISKADATAGVITVYVKFAPNSGNNGAIANTISVTSTDAAAKTVAVTGNETGNVSTALLLAENFEYGSSDALDIAAASSSAWATHSTASTGGPTAPEMNPDYSATGLTYAGYPGSGVGGAMAFIFGSSGTNDGDVNRKFTKIDATQTFYMSCLLNLSAAKSGDYFLHLGPNDIGNTFAARFSARANGAGWSFGFAKTTEAATTDGTVLDFNKTYLVVFKIEYSTATTTDDVVSVYLYDGTIPTSESDTYKAAILSIGATKNDGVSANYGSVAIRQSGNGPTGKIDGIRVAKNWADLFN